MYFVKIVQYSRKFIRMRRRFFLLKRRSLCLYEVIYMKADFEPWWMFDGWEETVISRQSFNDLNNAINYLDEQLMEFRKRFKNENMQKQYCYAFWTEEEKQFCEACDDDLQIFHGLFLLYKGKPYI